MDVAEEQGRLLAPFFRASQPSPTSSLAEIHKAVISYVYEQRSHMERMMPAAVENGSDVIIRAAKQQLNEEGFHKLSIRKIAQRCGLGVGTIYNYFPTKKDLIIRLMTDYWEEFYAHSSVSLDEETNIYGKLQKIYFKLRKFVELFKESWTDIQDFNKQNPYEHSAQQMKYLQRLYTLVADLLKDDFERRGKTSIHIDLDDLARMIVLNYLTMIYTNQLPYDSFERIVKMMIE